MAAGRRGRWIASLVAGSLVSLSLMPPAASAHGFGHTPLNDVINASSATGRCSGLTGSELAAMVLAPTWGDGIGCGGPLADDHEPVRRLRSPLRVR
jgi:hypothetical protein